MIVRKGDEMVECSKNGLFFNLKLVQFLRINTTSEGEPVLCFPL